MARFVPGVKTARSYSRDSREQRCALVIPIRFIDRINDVPAIDYRKAWGLANLAPDSDFIEFLPGKLRPALTEPIDK